MPHYKKGSGEILERLARVVEKYHGDLQDAEVTFDVLYAYATKNEHGEPRGPALSHGGYPAIATVKINPLKARVLGGADALISIDGDSWAEFSSAQQNAIIDHELTHLELVESEDGVEGDDIGRPKLKFRKHDHQFGWFDDVVRRHGRDSIEWSQFAAFQEKALKQLWLPGLGDAPPAASDDGSDEDFTRAVGDTIEKALEGSGVELQRNVTLTRGGHGVERRKGRGRKAAAMGWESRRRSVGL